MNTEYDNSTMENDDCRVKLILKYINENYFSMHQLYWIKYYESVVCQHTWGEKNPKHKPENQTTPPNKQKSLYLHHPNKDSEKDAESIFADF